MSEFTAARILFDVPLVAEKADGLNWIVARAFKYELGFLGSGETIMVPLGFKSDLASIPRIFWSILPPDEAWAQAAVLHDWLCSRQGRVEKLYTVEQVSLIFREAMQVLAVPAWKREIMYWAVLRFGPKWEIKDNENNRSSYKGSGILQGKEAARKRGASGGSRRFGS